MKKEEASTEILHSFSTRFQHGLWKDGTDHNLLIGNPQHLVQDSFFRLIKMPPATGRTDGRFSSACYLIISAIYSARAGAAVSPGDSIPRR
jgi:hypothetical protein